MRVGSKIRIKESGSGYIYTKPRSEGIVKSFEKNGYCRVAFYKLTVDSEGYVNPIFNVQLRDCEEISTNIFEGKCNKI